MFHDAINLASRTSSLPRFYLTSPIRCARVRRSPAKSLGVIATAHFFSYRFWFSRGTLRPRDSVSAIIRNRKNWLLGPVQWLWLGTESRRFMVPSLGTLRHDFPANPLSAECDAHVAAWSLCLRRALVCRGSRFRTSRTYAPRLCGASEPHASRGNACWRAFRHARSIH